jgi:anti-sigma-K factor RskA
MSDLHILTGAYALDALDDVERAGFERHLRDCDSCTIEVMEFRESAVSLAERVFDAAPVGMRSRVLAEVRTTRQQSPGRVSLHRPSLRRTLATAVAAMVIAAGAGLGGVAWQGHRAAHTAQVEASGLARVMTDPGRIEVVGAPSVGGTATVVAAGGSAVFATDKLPAPPTGKAYQLWLIRPDQKITSAGLLKLRHGSGQSLVTGVTVGSQVAVSVEPAGGSKQPTTKPVLALTVV